MLDLSSRSIISVQSRIAVGAWEATSAQTTDVGDLAPECRWNNGISSERVLRA